MSFNISRQKYLKSEQHYIDLYDRNTVERCRNLIRIHLAPIENPPLINGIKPTKELLEGTSKMILELRLLYEKGNQYLRKQETIRKWMAADEARDKFFESTIPPENIECLKCHSVMNLIDKDLWTGDIDKADRVLFMFDCPNKCLPRRAFFNTGEEWRPKHDFCPECGQELETKDAVTEAKFITNYKCVSCGFTKTEELERTANKGNIPDPNYEADRERFCLSKEAGEKWRHELPKWEALGNLVDKMKEREKNEELYDKVAKIKKLNIAQLQALVGPIIEKSGYLKLEFEKPVIDRHVVISFTAQDAKTDREEYSSKVELRQLLEKALAETNWRLMSVGISYRLGILSGNLRAYETETELIGLVNFKK